MRAFTCFSKSIKFLTFFILFQVSSLSHALHEQNFAINISPDLLLQSLDDSKCGDSKYPMFSLKINLYYLDNHTELEAEVFEAFISPNSYLYLVLRGAEKESREELFEGKLFAIRADLKGVIDRSFGEDGIQILEQTNRNSIYRNMMVDSSENIYLSLSQQVNNRDEFVGKILKYNEVGGLVKEFGKDGVLELQDYNSPIDVSNIALANNHLLYVNAHKVSIDVDAKQKYFLDQVTGEVVISLGTSEAYLKSLFPDFSIIVRQEEFDAASNRIYVGFVSTGINGINTYITALKLSESGLEMDRSFGDRGLVPVPDTKTLTSEMIISVSKDGSISLLAVTDRVFAESIGGDFKTWSKIKIVQVSDWGNIIDISSFEEDNYFTLTLNNFADIGAFISLDGFFISFFDPDASNIYYADRFRQIAQCSLSAESYPRQEFLLPNFKLLPAVDKIIIY